MTSLTKAKCTYHEESVYGRYAFVMHNLPRSHVWIGEYLRNHRGLDNLRLTNVYAYIANITSSMNKFICTIIIYPAAMIERRPLCYLFLSLVSSQFTFLCVFTRPTPFSIE